MPSEFSSAGFDLDQSSGDVVLEIGGGVSQLKVEESKPEQKENRASSLIEKSEEIKKRGNEYFKQGSYLDAYDMYTEAIESCPGVKGEEILKMKEEHDEAEHAKAVELHRSMDTERREKLAEGKKSDLDKDSYKMKPFEPPSHVFGDKLAVYYSNRAACLLHLNRCEEAIKDCDIAVLLNPLYTKAWMRRSSAYEKIDKIEEAFRDVKKALEIEPSNPKLRKDYQRLEKLEKERLEKLKEETMEKLKDLGNMFLGNFGLSLDNFQATQDPNTGSYSISFDQNGNTRSV